MKWSYGITTVPSRAGVSLPKTLGSLSRGGFPNPWVFVDGGKPEQYGRLLDLGFSLTFRYPKIGAFGNWILSLWELYLRNPKADRYVIFQDDVICVRNLREYLERKPLPGKGYANLFSFMTSNEKRLKPENYGRWVKSDQYGRGALGLVFDREAVKVLLSSSNISNKPGEVKWNQTHIDGAVSTALSPTHKRSDFTEYIHNPSLLQHTGIVSSIGAGNNNQPQALSFPGEEFDCLTLLTAKTEKESEIG